MLFPRLLLWTLACASACDAYRVLVVFAFPGKSHGILGEGVVRLLLNAGYEVTYITSNAIKTHPNLHQIDVSADVSKPVPNLKSIMTKEQNAFDPQMFFNMTVGAFTQTFRNKEVQQLLNDPKQTFDLVLSEWMFTELYVGFAAVYRCPFIWLSTVEPHSVILSLIDESLNPAFNSGLMSSGTPPFTFVQRVKELLIHIATIVLKDWYFAGLERQEYVDLVEPLLRKKGLPVPEYNEVKYNISLVLGNSHVSLGQATKLPQSYVPVGGYHIDTNIKPLPEDLKQLMDSAKHGVIYFSLGSNVKSKDLPDEVKKDLLQMFGTLKQTVLWKFEEDLPNRPGNVHILKWAPQPSILSHPNCILFITHGGLLSTTEAVFFGKATVGIPVFADQFTNVERAVKKGFGRKVDLSFTMADDLKAAILEVLQNPSYTKKAKELSFIYHHRPVPPGAALVHWVEHVIRTQGAPHLRSPALHVPFYQKMYLDLLALVIVAIVALKFACKALCRLVCRRSVDKNKKNK